MQYVQTGVYSQVDKTQLRGWAVQLAVYAHNGKNTAVRGNQQDKTDSIYLKKKIFFLLNPHWGLVSSPLLLCEERVSNLGPTVLLRSGRHGALTTLLIYVSLKADLTILL
jgi:hypothetical protein